MFERLWLDHLPKQFLANIVSEEKLLRQLQLGLLNIEFMVNFHTFNQILPDTNTILSVLFVGNSFHKSSVELFMLKIAFFLSFLASVA